MTHLKGFASCVFGISLFLSGSSLQAQEQHLHNIRQLTFGGDNAEAYFSPDGNRLTLQISNPGAGIACDQIHMLDLSKDAKDPSALQLISTGTGRTTCSFFMPDGKHILYASTHEGSHVCPQPPKDEGGRYVWPIFSDYDIYIADLKGNIVKRLTDWEGYDAEAVVSPDGKKIAFTSLRSGDLEIWVMDIDGSNLKQLTHGLGYDGGAFFSHDSKKLVFRASRPNTPEAIKEYKELLAKGLVAPNHMEIYTINVDGTDLRQITHLGKANWSPYFHPSDKKIIFSSNHHSTRGYDFQLFMIDTDGDNLQQITWQSGFNAFPMFSPDGKQLVFSSNRNPEKPKDTDVFIADWVDSDPVERSNKGNLKTHISYLASDELEGRLAGSPAAKKAANYIADELKKLKLKPYKNQYLHDFTYKAKTSREDTLNTTEVKATNVVAYIDNKAAKTIVIGAHFDHLGKNERAQSREANAVGLIHNGADDNASGVAAVLELARMLSQNQTKEPANYVFAFFSGEEDGLMGSKNIAAAIKKDFPNVLGMINLDMVGRLDQDKNLIIGGVGTNPNFTQIVERQKPAGFHITLDESGIGSSDHTSFYLQDIPVLFFFTGNHSEYHKPSDDEPLINYYGVKSITDYVFRVARELEAFDSVTFLKTKANAGRKAAKYKVTLGVMPDYAEHGDGLHIDGVTEGRPADLAGIESGDIITKIGDCLIKDVYDYMECLSNINPKDIRPVTFIRNGNEQTVSVTF
jgi:Tol biopolymer transport system component